MKKVVFMGTPQFSVPILTMLVEEGYEVVAVVTQPDRPVGRKRVMTPPPVKVEADRLGLLTIQPEKITPEVISEIQALQPDLLITAAFGQILPEALLQLPTFGAINVHASLLPKYRGGAPIHQAIIDGQRETGVTIMYMVKRLDAGNMIAQRSIPITDADDTGILFEKLSLVGEELLKETLPTIFNRTNASIPQNEEEVTFASNISREQERIDWNRPGRAIFNQIRGLHPWPVAFTTFKGETVKIWQAHLVSSPSEKSTPGEILVMEGNQLIVSSADQEAIAIQTIQPAGKKKMDVAQFINGNGDKWKVGESFE